MRPLFFLLVCLPVLLQGQRGLDPAKVPAADGSRRLALLIGNSAYEHSRQLSNPVHDVDSMEVVLREVGFDVMKVKNADKRTTETALNAFTRRVKDEQYAVSLVFFAGHGLQVNGVNYLVPVEANPEYESDVKYSCMVADQFLDRMAEGGASTKILLLDACRNNPLPRSWGRSGGGGLAQMTAPEGTFIGFATAANQEALDGSTARNSPYTTAMLRHLREPGLDIDQVFTQVTKTTGDLSAQQGKKQVPFKYSSLPEPFYFTLPRSTQPDGPAPGLKYGTLKIIPDADCIVRIDGRERARLKSGELGRLELAAGAHWVECVGVSNSGMRFEQEVRVTLTEEVLLRVVLGEKSTVPRDLPDGYTDQAAGRFILVKGGTFDMGCTDEQSKCGNDEQPVRKVTLGDYYMGETEVTQAQWRAVMGSEPPKPESNDCDACPVEGLSWNDVQEFIKRLNSRSGGLRYRLPTEAEWEYAARGGSLDKGGLYSGSDELEEVAWYRGNAGGKSQPVRGRKPNELGLYDMSGNVWEWCSDWYGAYPSRNQLNPSGAASGSRRVYRGGSWGDYPVDTRVTLRFYGAPGNRYKGVGFRLARTP